MMIKIRITELFCTKGGMLSDRYLLGRYVLVVLFSLISLSGSAQVSALGNTGVVGGWYKLGRLHLPQQGVDAVIEIAGGNGYNADHHQNSICKIHFRTSNGSSNQNGFYANGSYYHTGRSRLINVLKVVQVDLGTWDFYADLTIYTGIMRLSRWFR